MANPWDNDPIVGPADDQPWLNDVATDAAAPSPRLDWRNMTKDQLMEAYRTLPRDDPQRELVKKMLVASTDVPTMTPAQSVVAGATDAMSLGLSDEINAAIAPVTSRMGLSASTTGNYEDELAAQRQMMRDAEESNPGYYVGGQIAGGLVSGAATGGATGTLFGATRAAPALTRTGRLVQKAGNVGKSALTAGIGGAVYGFNSGEGGVDARLRNARDVGVTSAVLGPVAEKVAKGIGRVGNRMRGETPIWTPNEIEEASQRLYRQATQAGATVQPNTMANVGRRMVGEVLGDINYSSDVPQAFTNARLAMDIVDRVFIKRQPKPGAAPRAPRGIVPGGTQSMQGLKGGTPTSLEELEVVRRRLTKLAGSTMDDDEARMIFKMRSALDEAIDNLTPADMANGSPAVFQTMDEARKLWRVKSETEWADEMLRRAKNSAGQYSISKTENAIRTQARQAAQNTRKFRRFSDPVKEAVENVANPGFAQNRVRDLGKFAPLGGGYGPTIAAIAPAVGVPLMAAGQVAQIASHQLTKKNFRNLQRTIQRSMAPKPVPVRAGEVTARRAVPFAVPGLLGDEVTMPFLTDAQGREYNTKGKRTK